MSSSLDCRCEPPKKAEEAPGELIWLQTLAQRPRKRVGKALLSHRSLGGQHLVQSTVLIKAIWVTNLPRLSEGKEAIVEQLTVGASARL